MKDVSEQLKDCFYTAVRMNAEINIKDFKELTEKNAINSFLDISDRNLLLRIVNGEFNINQKTVSRIKKILDSYNQIQNIARGYMNTADSLGISIISCNDKNYPYNWKIQSGMPKVFYARGNEDLLNKMTLNGSVAVVGSRNPSKYSLYATEQICKSLGDKGITTVSGMALGIDRQAHLSSAETLGGTIAVLAGGVDNIYPPANKDIYQLICSKGLVISEMPPGQTPIKQYFPSRNRLIAGLTDCTLIMEAGKLSGTLHTASFAANQGKEIFVLPNSIYYENALGGLKILEDGGNILLNPESVIDSISHALMYKRMTMGRKEDIFFRDFEKEEIDDKVNINIVRELSKVKPEALDDEQWKILIKDSLTLKPLCADELCVMLSLPFYKISKLLTELELNGTVCQSKGKYSLTFV